MCQRRGRWNAGGIRVLSPTGFEPVLLRERSRGPPAARREVAQDVRRRHRAPPPEMELWRLRPARPRAQTRRVLSPGPELYLLFTCSHVMMAPMVDDGVHRTAPVSAHPVSTVPRSDQLGTLLRELIKRSGDAPPDRYAALAGLLEDAKLDGDHATLLLAQRALQRLYSRQLAQPMAAPRHHEQRGRTLQALDGVTWSLHRLTPPAANIYLEEGSRPRRFLEVIAEHPGLYSGQIAELLDQAREDVVSHVGSRLEQSGFARKVRVGRRKHWYITPRGRRALDLRPFRQ